MPMVK